MKGEIRMTKIEKEIVAAALSEYAVKHQKAADRFASRKNHAGEVVEQMRANIAMQILSYWRDIIDELCNSVKI